MARTKQTARKSTGGCAPRLQLASKSAGGMKRFLLSQQHSGPSTMRGFGGVVQGPKKIFINCENTFAGFQFDRVPSSKSFEPIVHFARVKDSQVRVDDMSKDPTSSVASEEDPLYMRLEFSSKFDGAMTQEARFPLDLAFVLDISGSMASPFPEDSDRRTKLQVAKDCLLMILDKLTPEDRVALITFNDTQKVVSPLKNATKSNLLSLRSKVKSITTSGGTHLSGGLASGFKVLSESKPSAGEDTRFQRVFFLTDMESSAADEDAVLQMSKQQACLSVTSKSTSTTGGISKASKVSAAESSCLAATRSRKRGLIEVVTDTLTSISGGIFSRSSTAPAKKSKCEAGGAVAHHERSPIFLTLVGIGVDLSAHTVNRLSAIPGAKYMSAVNAAELYSTVAGDFEYDVFPLAFNIQLELPEGYFFEKILGSAELNDLTGNETKATISAEFPVPIEVNGETNGAIYVCKLRQKETSRNAKSARKSKARRDEDQLQITWTDTEANLCTATFPIIETPDSSVRDLGLIKALALSEYVSEMTNYANSNDEEPATTASCSKCPQTTKNALSVLNVDGVLAIPTSELPSGTPKSIQSHQSMARRFMRLKDHLVNTLTACGDTSLWTTNKNILQTVSQVIELETVEVRKQLVELCAGSRSTKSSNAHNPVPRGFLCPINLTIMKHPVIAADGHSYERLAIEMWLASHNTSPLTNLPLAHKLIVDNHALKQAIEEYLDGNKRDAVDDDADDC